MNEVWVRGRDRDRFATEKKRAELEGGWGWGIQRCYGEMRRILIDEYKDVKTKN